MHPFALTVQCAQKKGEFRRSLAPLGASGLVQLGVLGLLVVAPLLGMPHGPKPEGSVLVYSQPAVVVGPPHEAPATRRTPRSGPRLSTTLEGWAIFQAPTLIPDDIGPGGEPPGAGGSSVPGGYVPLTAEPTAGVTRPEAPVRRGGVVEHPRKVRHVEPIYPAAARLARIAGDVVLEAIIDPQGNVTDLRVVQSIPLLDRAALDAVRQWKYASTLLNGVHVPVVMRVTVTFRLD